MGPCCFALSLRPADEGRREDMQHLRLQQEVLWSSIIANFLSGRQEEKDWLDLCSCYN